MGSVDYAKKTLQTAVRTIKLQLIKPMNAGCIISLAFLPNWSKNWKEI